jgi:hypothetical protein
MKKNRQEVVNESIIAVLKQGDDRMGKIEAAMGKGFSDMDDRVKKLENKVIWATGVFAAVFVWWEVQGKDTLFPKENTRDVLNQLIHEIKSMKAAK